MMNFTRNLWKRGQNQSLSTNEIELTDAQLTAVQGAVGGPTGGGHHDHDGDGHHHGGGWYGGGYPSYYPSYGYGYGYQPAPQVVLVQSVPATTQQTPCTSLPVSSLPVSSFPVV